MQTEKLYLLFFPTYNIFKIKHIISCLTLKACNPFPRIYFQFNIDWAAVVKYKKTA